jgi:spore coat polysaccharide biosynthesis protein SpsF (cytidylyltransferase family)
VATSSNADNDVIASFCQQSGISCFRGSEDDVLGRLLAALKAYRADVGVELFGDGPLIDPAIIDVMINFYLENENKYDFVSNDLKTTFPPGQEVEVYSTMALEDASGRAVSPDIREHGTLFIRQHPELYRLYNISAPPPLNYPEIEIELDTFEDFKVVQSIIENLYPAKPDFTIYDIIGFLQKYPALMETNKNIPRRWKQYRQDEV